MQGLGTVYKKSRVRKDGGTRVFYVAQIRMTINGVSRRIEGQGQTPAAAVAARERAVAKALTGVTRTPTHTQKPESVLALMTDWSATRDVKPRTREHTASVIKNHIDGINLADKRLRSLRREDIERLLDSKKGWTRFAVYKVMRGFLSHALTEGLIKDDPMKDIKKPHPPRATGANSATMDKRVRLMRGMIGWMKTTNWMKDNPMYWCRIQLALDGLRPGEARGISWDDVLDLHGTTNTHVPRLVIRRQLGYADGKLSLMPVKGDAPRVVVLRPTTAEALKAWKKQRGALRRRKTWHPREGMETLVLTLEDGRPLRQQDDGKMWRALQLQAQKNYSPERRALWPMSYNRHIAVSIMRDSGASASAVSTIMGHSIAVEDSIYYQPQTTAQRDAMAAMDAYITTTTTKKTKK
ncbi:tyrosine recombinase XerC [Bifidobacterium aquikefiricola]|uniref:Tyrosine-type recombinase/integrase n=1 Tax=Bifidobacterium aquikefiricola TaxID=3059038 RepID=A0AB39U7R5_9BIFI